MTYELTQHARDVLEEREIAMEWMERVLANPALVEPGATDPELENRFARIAEFGDRVLRVGSEHAGCSRTGSERIFRQENERPSMKSKVDREADALYLRLDDSKIVDSEEVSPGVVLDYNDENQVVGVEILDISKRAPSLNPRELQFQTG